MSCYHFQLLTYEEGLLDKSVDATYIIHLENNGRLEHIHTMLSSYKPSKLVYILYNKGYKKCSKHSSITSSPLDLVDAFQTIFHDAKHKEYRSILILEDDFTFLPKMKEISVLQNINQFVEERREKEFVYHLGCIPYLRIPTMNYSSLLFSTGMHASIYSDKVIEKVLQEKEKIYDWDTYFNMNFIGSRYMDNHLLCYQLFPHTENSKEWGNEHYLLKKIGKVLHSSLSLLELDKRHDLGYPFFYVMSIVMFVIILLLLFYLIKYTVSCLKK